MNASDVATIDDLIRAREAGLAPAWSPPFAEGCALCGHVYAQLHRLRPGCWGGDYSPGNVVPLCPNHHAAVHLLMDWCRGERRGRRARLSAAEEARIDAYHANRELRRFWLMVVKPIVRARLAAEGRWHPCVRTLPPAAIDRADNRRANRLAKAALARAQREGQR